MQRETDTQRDGPGRLARVAFAAVMVTAALALAPATTAAQSNASNATFIVQQGSQCTQVTPLGDGTRTVEDFYDYQVLNETANYSSLGTVDIQEDQTSQVFVYDGSDGLSLVFLNDEIGEPGGFVATAEISGLPADGDWVVEDDNYTDRDDVFEYTDTGAHIEWNSNGERTDGAAFAGLDSPNYSTVEVDIAFNDETDRYPFEEWSGQPSDNEIQTWQVRSGDGSTSQLDMSQPIQLSPGTCSGGVSTFTATPTPSTDAAGTTGTDVATSAPTAAATSTATTTSTATATGTTTSTATAAQTDASTRTAAAAETSAATDTAGTNGSAGEGDSESGAFGPGFGVVVAALALVLAGVGLARRQG